MSDDIHISMLLGTINLVYKRKFGKSNKEVSGLGMGCFALGGPFTNKQGMTYAYGKVDDKESIRTIHKALEFGINVFDTADVYGLGHSEEILGQALKGRREEVIIATKFGSVFDPEKRISGGKNVSPEYIHKAVDASLGRLQTDYIDIYQLHNSGQDPKRALGVRDTLEELVEMNKIRYYGWSTDDPYRVEEFAKGNHCIAIQYILSLTRYNTQIARICEENDLVGLIRSPFASGTFTGKYTKDTKRDSDHMLADRDFGTEQYQQTFQKLDEIKELLKNDDRTLVQGILGYIWAKNDRVIPIPGAKTVDQITENAKSLEQGPISQKLMQEIDSIFSELQNDFSYESFPYYSPVDGKGSET